MFVSTFQVLKLDEISNERRQTILRRSRYDISKIEPDVRKIMADMKERGDECTAEFLSGQVGRKVSPSEIVVKQQDISEAYRKIGKDTIRAIRRHVRNVRLFHRKQLPKPFTVQIEKGVFAGQLVVPLDSAGLYVPSGKASYPSVAGMTTTAASVAGVPRIAVASPPSGNDMRMDPATLVAAHMAGGSEFYVMGGTHAIAAFAFGTKLVKPVSCIAGPGGAWTFVAKRLASDLVRLDLPAGPSEALVYSDGTVNATQVAWDVLNEAEHGPDSAGVLVTTSLDFAEQVAAKIEEALASLPEPRASFVKENASKYSAIIVCSNEREAVNFINEYAPEHLCMDCRSPGRFISKKMLTNFGTICLNTPISAGNFGVGPNSTLPTGGYARLFSGLSPDAFLKKPTVEEFRGKSWKSFGKNVIKLAEYEGFPSHAKAMETKLKEIGG